MITGYKILGVFGCLPELSKIPCTSKQRRVNWVSINLLIRSIEYSDNVLWLPKCVVFVRNIPSNIVHSGTSGIGVQKRHLPSCIACF